MTTTNILLAMTSLLIVVAFGLTFGGFSKDRNSSESKEEIAALRKEWEALQAENRALELSQTQALRAVPAPVTTPAPISVTPSTANPLDDARIAELEKEIENLKDENDTLEQEMKIVTQPMNEAKAEQQRKAKRISMALDMGTVVTANKETGFVIFKPSLSAPNHQPGTILSVRRNSGILGDIIVERLAENGQYVANMKPQVFAPDGYPDIIPGDTIIVNPD
ncbi:MAG: hypothetical protein ACPGJR_00885 [Akkermansiaceae bacterium]